MAARHLNFSHTDRRKRPYWRDERLLGKTIMDKQQEHVLIIGKDTWSRQDMVEQLKCGNFMAAQNLTKIAAKLQVDSLKQLAARFTMEDLFHEDRFGIMTMFVLMCALESDNKNPLEWIDHKADEIVTLSTEKHRAMKAEQEAAKARVKATQAEARKHARQRERSGAAAS